MTTTLELLARPCIARKPGLSGYKIDRCRCAVCTRASYAYQAKRDKAIGYGTWNPLVDAEPARAHLRMLGRAGIGWQRAAILAGVSNGSVSHLLYGSSGRPPAKRCRRQIAEAVMALRPESATLPDGAKVDATGTQRRMQAMVVDGWSLSEQARRVGRTVQNYSYSLTARKVTVRVARDVAELHEALLGVVAAGPMAARSRRWGRSQGWHPSAAWDDDTINDPEAGPNYGVAVDDIVDDVAIERVNAGKLTFGKLTKAEQVELFRRFRGAAGRGTLCLRWGIGIGTFRRLERAVSPTGEAAA